MNKIPEHNVFSDLAGFNPYAAPRANMYEPETQPDELGAWREHPVRVPAYMLLTG